MVIFPYTTVNSFGYDVGGVPGGTDHGTLRYKKTSDSTWRTGHNAPKVNTGHLIGSAFFLQPNTSYDIEVTARDVSEANLGVITATLSTQMDLPWSPAINKWYVDAAAPGGGNGSAGAPYNNLQTGINAAQAGDWVLVAPGTYNPGVGSFFAPPRDGAAGKYIKIIGSPGAIIDGTDTTISAALAVQGNWTVDGSHPNVYSTVLYSGMYNVNGLTGDPIWKDNNYTYEYGSLSDLWSGTSQNASGLGTYFIAEGWYFDNDGTHGTGVPRTLTVRSLTPPWKVSGVGPTWHVRNNGYGSLNLIRAYIWIEGFTIQFFPIGVYVTSCTNNIVRYCDIKAGTGVLVDSGQGPLGDANRVENNHMSAYPLGSTFGYNGVKNTPMEQSGIKTDAKGTIVRDNRIEEFFNGIYSGINNNFEQDTYRNVMRNIGDDGLEPEGNNTNYRAWGNAVDGSGSGVSMAPIGRGPAWILFNRFTKFYAKGFKLGTSTGTSFQYCYHNTVWSDDSTAAEGGAPGNFGVSGGQNDTIVMRNNIIRVRGYGWRWSAATPNLSWDRDSIQSIVGNLGNHYLWNNIGYATRAALCSGQAQECNGFEGDPKLIDPTNLLFGLASGSPNIDAALVIPGINDTFSGAGPDRGYLEFGGTEINWTLTGGISGLVTPQQLAVTITAGNSTAITNPDGSYDLLALPPGTYTVTYTATGYKPVTQTVTVVSGGAVVAPTVSMLPQRTFTLLR